MPGNIFSRYSPYNPQTSGDESGSDDVSNYLTENSFGKLEFNYPRTNKYSSDSLNPKSEGVTLSWRNIDCFAPPTVKKRCWGSSFNKNGNYKQLLHNLSGLAIPGKFLAVMGASGAGKTTLLNVLTCRSRNLTALRVNGVVKVNGVDIGANIKHISAYVEQTECFYGNLTVREHLIYSAILRMSKHYPTKYKEKRVNDIIFKMGLESCANLRINSNVGIQGISGSERKLLSLASELIIDQPLIFCDEPTTGLDYTMALTVVKMLKQMAESGKTVFCTIHQPASYIFDKFDQLILLAEGKLAFHGTLDEASQFYSNVLHHPCPTNYNPADHYIHSLAIRPGNEYECLRRVEKVTERYLRSPNAAALSKCIYEIENTTSENSTYQMFDDSRKEDTLRIKYRSSWWGQVKIITWKQLIDQYRDPRLFAVRLFQCFAITLILSTLYYNQTINQVGVANLNNGMYMLLVTLLDVAISQLNSYTILLNTFYRDQENGLYRVSSFYCAKNISDLPIFFITVLFSSTCVYWIIGMYPALPQYLIAVFVYALVYHGASSILVYTLGTLSGSTQIALSLIAPCRSSLSLVSGYWANEGTIPPMFRWLRYFSFQWYGYRMLIFNQWQNIEDIKCDKENVNACFRKGSDVIEFLNYTNTDLLRDGFAFVGLVIGFRLLPYFILSYKSRKRRPKSFK